MKAALCWCNRLMSRPCRRCAHELAYCVLATPPPDALQAYRRANHRLRQDNAVGVITEAAGAEVLRLPGRELPEPLTFGAFNQEGSVDGVVIRLGGTSDPVPVHIETPGQAVSHCYASREVAKAIGGYIFGPELRVHGTARWFRDEEGLWVLDRFTISSFEVIDGEPLSAVVARLREVPGSKWPTLEDPWRELEKLRYGFDETD